MSDADWLDQLKATRHARKTRPKVVVDMAEHIRKLVDAAPPLSQSQKDRLAMLLRRGEQ